MRNKRLITQDELNELMARIICVSRIEDVPVSVNEEWLFSGDQCRMLQRAILENPFVNKIYTLAAECYKTRNTAISMGLDAVI